MKCEIIIDPDCEEVVRIYAHKRSEITDRIERAALGTPEELVGYKDKRIFTLDPAEVHCFTVEDNRVYALTQKHKLLLRQRLYQLEETLDEGFVKINQSCIANIRQIHHFDASVSAALSVTFKNGYKDYVSRRQLKAVKERIGFKL